jgi:hypothetical protein
MFISVAVDRKANGVFNSYYSKSTNSEIALQEYKTLIDYFILAESRTSPKRVTAEYGSDLSLSCTFQNRDSDETVN